MVRLNQLAELRGFFLGFPLPLRLVSSDCRRENVGGPFWQVGQKTRPMCQTSYVSRGATHRQVVERPRMWLRVKLAQNKIQQTGTEWLQDLESSSGAAAVFAAVQSPELRIAMIAKLNSLERLNASNPGPR